MTEPIMPLFVFKRRMDIERERGFTLAGKLLVAIGSSKPKPGEDELMADPAAQARICSIIQLLRRLAEQDKLPDGSFVRIIGWPGGRKPDNAVDTDDDAVMAAWAARAAVIVVTSGDKIPIDSDVAGILRI